VQYLGELGADFVVYKNDEKTVDEIKAMNPAGILVSPGPGEDCLIDRVVMGVL
jgi:anthranilate synthase component 2